jgi:hypothetical protein
MGFTTWNFGVKQNVQPLCQRKLNQFRVKYNCFSFDSDFYLLMMQQRPKALKFLRQNWCMLKTKCDVMTYLLIYLGLLIFAGPIPKVIR